MAKKAIDPQIAQAIADLAALLRAESTTKLPGVEIDWDKLLADCLTTFLESISVTP